MFRQGDVYVTPIKAIPAGAEKMERDARYNGVVLAYGEVTGHAHVIREKGVTMFRDAKLNETFLDIPAGGPVALKHDEHETIEIPAGKYKVVRQVEYTPEAIRNVAD